MDVCRRGSLMGVCLDNASMCLSRFSGLWSASLETLVFRAWLSPHHAEYSSLRLHGSIMYVSRFRRGSTVPLDCCWEERADGVGRQAHRQGAV